MANNTLLASDNFASGSLAAGWSMSPVGNGTLPVVVAGSPNVIQPTTTSVSEGIIWSGLTWGNDQIAEFTINNISNTGNALIAAEVRLQNVGGNPQGYQLALNPSTPIVQIQKLSGGVQSILKSVTATAASGDVWTFAAIGSVLFAYQNGTLVAYVSDTSLAGSGGPGAPAVLLNSNSTSATSVQISSIRLYSVQQQDGIWTKQGCILPGTSTEMGGTPNGNAGLSVNFGPSVFLSPGQNVQRGYWVYRSGTIPEVAYGESLDGKVWSRYSSNPVISGTGGGCVNWINGTAYMYGQSTPGSVEPHLFTSPDGVTWTDQGACTGLQPAGFSSYSICALAIINGTYYGLFGALTNSTFVPVTFLATSTDGKTYTIQNGGSPVIANGFCGCNMFKVGSTYYMPVTASQGGQGSSAAGFDPCEGVLYQCSDPTFVTWTLNSHSLHNSLINDSLNNKAGGIAPLCIVDVNGTAYHYYQGSPGDNTGPQDYQCMLATAPLGVSRASVVKFSQLATAQVASDNFSGGTGNLPSVNPNWTTPTWSTTLQVVAGNLLEATLATGARCTGVYTGASFGRNQYSEATLHTLSAGINGAQLYLLLCATTSGNQQAYYAQIPSPTGTLTTGNNLQIIKLVNGVQTMLTPVATPNNITPQVGDVFRFAVVQGSDGSNILTLYQNGFQVLMAQDYAGSLTSGSPGIQLNTNSLTANQVSSWAGGNTNSLPNFPSSGGSWLQANRDFANKRGVRGN